LSLTFIGEKEIPFQNQVVIQAFSGSGLVSIISAKHLIGELGLHLLGYLDSDLVPPLALVEEGVVKRPIQVFGNKEYILVMSQANISQKNLKSFIRELFRWYDGLGITSLRILAGLPTGRDNSALSTTVEIVATDESTTTELRFLGAKTMSRGFVFGSIAVSLLEAQARGISAIAFLSNCIPSIPDFLAAKDLLSKFAEIEMKEIDLTYLEIRSNELREKLSSEDFDPYDSDVKYDDFR